MARLAHTTAAEVLLPLTTTARKYGYITWKKRHDPEVKTLLGKKQVIDLYIGQAVQRQKTIDWKKRRIGITYTLTRSLPTNVNTIRLAKYTQNGFRASFEQQKRDSRT